MLVREIMRANPITVSSKATCSDASRLMQAKDIYKLPVVAEERDLVGIVTKKDLLCALPSSAALLSGSEIDSLFGKMTISRVMTRRVIWVSEDCPLEEAARILVDNQIGSLPVMRRNRIVGIITKTDIFRAMMEALGGRVNGLRITIRLHEDTGELGAITDGIIQLGGKLICLSTFWDDDAFNQTVTLKVQEVDPQELISFLDKNIGVEVIDYQHPLISPPEDKEAVLIQDLDSKFLQLMDSK